MDLNILDVIDAEGNLRTDLRRRYIMELSAQNNGGKTTAAAPTEYYLKDPFTFTTAGRKITRDYGEFSIIEIWCECRNVLLTDV